MLPFFKAFAKELEDGNATPETLAELFKITAELLTED